MFSHGICIMSMVHRQRAVLLQFPLVIYLAALLKCSCRWHWLTNQTVKLHPEYQRKHCFKIFVYHLLLDYVLHTSSWWDWLFFLWRTSPWFSFRLVKGIKPKRKTLVDRRACCSLLLLAQQINILLKAPLSSHRSVFHIDARGGIHLCVTSAWNILWKFLEACYY